MPDPKTSPEAVVLDWNNHKVRQVQADGSFQTIVGTDFVGDGPTDLSDLVGNGEFFYYTTSNPPPGSVSAADRKSVV